MNPYVPIIVFFALGIAFAVTSVLGFTPIGPRSYNRTKLDAYECGIEPSPVAAGGGKVPIKFYLTAMLFIVFDVETLFLVPFAVAFDRLGLFAVVEMVLFVMTIFIVYAYVWRRGGLEWD